MVPSTSTASIEVTHCDGGKERFSLPPGSYTVGRIKADVTLAGDRNVSRLHAKLEVLHKAVRLQDLDSTYGTFDSSGARVEEPYTMRVGDWLMLGRTKLQVTAVAELAVAGSSASTAMTQPELELDLGDA